MDLKQAVRILAVLMLAFAGVVPSGQAQKSGTTPAPTTPAPSTGSTRTPTTPTTTTQPSTTQQQPNVQSIDRPIYVSGRVLMEDGTPPPESLTMELVCGGSTRPQGYTDSKGRFQFQLGNNPGVMADASSSGSYFPGGGGGMNAGAMGNSGRSTGSGGFGTGSSMGTAYNNCDVRVVAPGFRSEMISLAGRRIMDNPEVGTIILKRIGNVEGTTISATSLNAPKDAKKAYEKGREAIKNKKLDQARTQLEKAVAIYPKYASAWYELGTVYERDKQIEAARKAYGESLAADSKYVSPYLRLASLSVMEQKWKDVVDSTNRLIKLNPLDFPAAYFFNSVANYNLENLDAAEKSARETLKRDDQHRFPKAFHLLGILQAQKRDFAGASESLKSYLKFAPEAKDTDLVKKQLAEVERSLAASTAAPPAQQP